MSKYRLSVEVRNNELQPFRVEHFEQEAESLSQAQEHVFDHIEQAYLQHRYVLRAVQIA